MSILARLFGFEATKTPETPQNVREAYGAQVDDDDANYRRLTGRNMRDLPSITTERARQIATHLWDTNLLANRLIELPLAFLLADGVRLECSDETGQAILDAHWTDPINRWEEKLPGRARDLALSGEQCWPVFVSPSGKVRVAYLDPELIEDTILDPGNSEEIIGVRTKPDLTGKTYEYKTIRAGEDTELYSSEAQALRAAMTGDCIYVAINRLPSRNRGKSDLLASADWLDGYDEFLFNELAGSHQRRAFCWDITLRGASPDTVKQRAKEITPPTPGSANIHNDTEEWKPMSPTLNAADTKEAARIFRGHALGGATLPEHWFGTADDVNKSTGESMTVPTLKVLTMRQRELTHPLVAIGRYVLMKAGITDPKIQCSVKVKWPELESKDMSRFAAALQQVIAGVAQALQSNVITHKTAIKIVGSISRMLQVEIDVEQELADAMIAKAEQAANDLFVPDAGNLPDPPPPSPTVKLSEYGL